MGLIPALHRIDTEEITRRMLRYPKPKQGFLRHAMYSLTGSILLSAKLEDTLQTQLKMGRWFDKPLRQGWSGGSGREAQEVRRTVRMGHGRSGTYKTEQQRTGQERRQKIGHGTAGKNETGQEREREGMLEKREHAIKDTRQSRAGNKAGRDRKHDGKQKMTGQDRVGYDVICYARIR